MIVSSWSKESEKIYEILGLKDQKVVNLKIEFLPTEPVLVTVEKYVTEKQMKELATVIEKFNLCKKEEEKEEK